MNLSILSPAIFPGWESVPNLEQIAGGLLGAPIACKGRPGAIISSHQASIASPPGQHQSSWLRINMTWPIGRLRKVSAVNPSPLGGSTRPAYRRVPTLTSIDHSLD